jgi:hypothetical protein
MLKTLAERLPLKLADAVPETSPAVEMLLRAVRLPATFVNEPKGRELYTNASSATDSLAPNQKLTRTGKPLPILVAPPTEAAPMREDQLATDQLPPISASEAKTNCSNNFWLPTTVRWTATNKFS